MEINPETLFHGNKLRKIFPPEHLYDYQHVHYCYKRLCLLK
jgi:hypothetical protein